MRVRRPVAASLVAAAALGVPAVAGGHSEVFTDQRGEITYLSADATSLNTLTIRASGLEIELRDPTVDGGIAFGSCRPGETDKDGYVIQIFCPRRGNTTLRIDLGEREDTMTVEIPLAVYGLGGPGADKMYGGPANDTFQGGSGNDVLEGRGGNDVLIGGVGRDTVDGGDGDDELRMADGFPDVIRCGPGNDRVQIDQTDELGDDAECEQVERQQVTPPPGAGDVYDVTAPKVRTDAKKRQKLSSGRVQVGARLSEVGAVAASGFLEAGGVRTVLQAKRRAIKAENVRKVLTARLSRSQRRAALRAKRRGRKVYALLQVVGTDEAGNSRRARTLRIRLV